MISCEYEMHISRCDTYSMDCPHFHDNIEIMLCISGEGVFFIDSGVYHLSRGQLFLISSSALHRSVADDAYRCLVFHISTAILREFSSMQSNFLARCSQSGMNVTLTEEETVSLEELYDSLSRSAAPGFGEDIRQTINVLSFLLFCFTKFDASKDQKAATAPELTPIVPILSYIQDHLAEPLSTQGLADHFYMNKYYFCRLFKTCTGFSVMDYIIKCRILQARSLLREGKRVQETGEAVGFRSNEHFIRTFKRLTGCSPKQYAMRYRASDQRPHPRLISMEGKDGRINMVPAGIL